jgi:hypothetical protein
VLAFTGLWWLAVPGLLVGALGWSTLAHGRKRGRGLALFAAIASLLAGGTAFTIHRLLVDELERDLDPFVRALVSDDRAELERWLASSEEASTRLPTWKARIDAVRAEFGAYAGRVEVGSVWMGALVVAMPRDIEEVPPRGDRSIEVGQALWIRAHFERGPVWLALLPPGASVRGSVAVQALSDLMEPLAAGSRTVVGDVRAFRPAR